MPPSPFWLRPKGRGRGLRVPETLEHCPRCGFRYLKLTPDIDREPNSVPFVAKSASTLAKHLRSAFTDNRELRPTLVAPIRGIRSLGFCLPRRRHS